MANYYGSNASLRLNQSVPALAPGKEVGGMKHVILDKYVLSAVFAANDLIYVGKLPKGAKVLEVKVIAPDMGGTGTMDVGYLASADGDEVADDNAFGSAVDISGQAIAYSMAGVAGGMAGYQKEFASEVEVVLKMPITATTSGTIYTQIEYVL
jgi:hypothetical protein